LAVCIYFFFFFFFFQAEDGIRDRNVTGVQTCALPISNPISSQIGLFGAQARPIWLEIGFGGGEHLADQAERHPEIGLIGCEVFRSEERRVGKECRSRWWAEQ